jgi:Zn-dependent peptidase ImmA (M78 family)/transcriptional regulator with XRE-family HTH domain
MTVDERKYASHPEDQMGKHVLDEIDPRALGRRLQEARKARGFTQQDVAEHLGVARTSLVAIEKGERRLTPRELITLAAYYGRSVPEFVTPKQTHHHDFVPQFRAALRREAATDNAFEQSAAELQALSENYAELEELCKMPMPKSYSPQYHISGALPEQAGEEVAATERNRLGVGDGPLGSPRERFENDVGLRIFYFEMPSKISGIFAYSESLGGCIGINSKHPRDRRNWGLAHEYGHFLTSRYQAEVTFLTESKRVSSRERFADNFAKSFLMPASGLNRRFSDLQRSSDSGITLAHILTLANLYQVSVQSLILRLEELRRLATGTWEKLVVEGFKVREAQQLLGIDANPPVKDTLPLRYKTLAVHAYNEGMLSEGQLARMLRTDRVSARIFVEEVTHRINTERDGQFTDLQLDLALPLAGR